MSNYSTVKLKHSIFLTYFECLVYKYVIYSQNTGFRQKGNGLDPPLSMWGVFTKITCEQRMNNYFLKFPVEEGSSIIVFISHRRGI